MIKGVSSSITSLSSSSERVRVAIRIRPLNTSERLQGHQNIIQIDNNKPNSITIWDPIGLEALDRSEFRDIDPSCWARHFTYDHCLYSSDDNEEELYKSQEEVFDTIGQPVVDWALDGYNACVLAYGQTGAGYILNHSLISFFIYFLFLFINFVYFIF